MLNIKELFKTLHDSPKLGVNEQYEQAMKQLRRNHEAEIDELKHEWAKANSKFNVGDIVEDHQGVTRLIERKGIYGTSIYGSQSYYQMWEGEILTKKFQPTKNKEKTRTVHEGNIQMKHG